MITSKKPKEIFGSIKTSQTTFINTGVCHLTDHMDTRLNQLAESQNFELIISKIMIVQVMVSMSRHFGKQQTLLFNSSHSQKSQNVKAWDPHCNNTSNKTLWSLETTVKILTSHRVVITIRLWSKRSNRCHKMRKIMKIWRIRSTFRLCRIQSGITTTRLRLLHRDNDTWITLKEKHWNRGCYQQIIHT